VLDKPAFSEGSKTSSLKGKKRRMERRRRKGKPFIFREKGSIFNTGNQEKNNGTWPVSRWFPFTFSLFFS
jgi:hypothetical protein